MAAELHLQVSPINFQVDPDSDESIKKAEAELDTVENQLKKCREDFAPIRTAYTQRMMLASGLIDDLGPGIYRRDPALPARMNICSPVSEEYIQWMENKIAETDLSANDKYRMLRDCDNLRVAHAKEQNKEEENL